MSALHSARYVFLIPLVLLGIYALYLNFRRERWSQ